MTFRRAKYRGEQDPRYGGNLFWHGSQTGIPFRGNAAPLLRQSEMENLPTFGDKHVAMFDLSDAEQLGNYIWVLDRAKNDLFTIDFCQRFFDPATHKVTVYLEWTQWVTQLPDTAGRP